MNDFDQELLVAGVVLGLLTLYVVRSEMRKAARARQPAVTLDPVAVRKRENFFTIGGILVVIGVATVGAVITHWEADWAKRSVRVTYWGPGGGNSRVEDRAGNPIASKVIHFGVLALGLAVTGLGGGCIWRGFRTNTVVAPPRDPSSEAR